MLDEVVRELFQPIVGRDHLVVLAEKLLQQGHLIRIEVGLVHRLGVVKVNEPSLWVEVVAPHRGEAFAACQWLIDEMKRVVPIWKRPLG